MCLCTDVFFFAIKCRLGHFPMIAIPKWPQFQIGGLVSNWPKNHHSMRSSTPIKAIQICTGFAKSHYDSNLGCRTLPGNGRFPCDVCSCSIQFLLFIGSMVIFCSLYVPTSSRIAASTTSQLRRREPLRHQIRDLAPSPSFQLLGFGFGEPPNHSL